MLLFIMKEDNRPVVASLEKETDKISKQKQTETNKRIYPEYAFACLYLLESRYERSAHNYY